MARNAEKAMTALARFRQAQLEEGKVKERRPFLASECTELPKAEKWRRQICPNLPVIFPTDHWRDLKKSCSDSECWFRGIPNPRPE
ncbi:rCG56103, isoform CRA_b [Rattus norvegicus]|uniref:RCG56103, isoform CRA_b n=1 Tax=Rattus norvegicus TaxID=10116 RepID=A6IB22_RAT|nr:rCG56103, isoform CRA_b [Rattus norvegicus]